MLLSTLLQEVDPTSFTSVLLWIIAGPGVVFLVGKFVSLVLENWSGWANFPTSVKFLVPIVLAALLGVGAQLLLAQPELVAAVEPWFKTVMLAILAWVGSQSQYLATKQAQYGARFR